MADGDDRQLRRIADDIVGAQARHSRRVRWALVSGAVLAVAVAVPLAVVVRHPQTAGHPVAADQVASLAPKAPRSSGRSAAGQSSGASDAARVYAVVIGGPRTAASGRTSATPIYVPNEFCTGLMDLHGSRGPGAPGPIPADLQAQIRGIVGPRLHFVASPPQPSYDARVVTIGTATIDGDRAQVAVDMECGPLCGPGETTILTRSGDQWRATGSTGPGWIS
jgi:hypothetical protein